MALPVLMKLLVRSSAFVSTEEKESSVASPEKLTDGIGDELGGAGEGRGLRRPALNFLYPRESTPPTTETLTFPLK